MHQNQSEQQKRHHKKKREKHAGDEESSPSEGKIFKLFPPFLENKNWKIFQSKKKQWCLRRRKGPKKKRARSAVVNRRRKRKRRKRRKSMPANPSPTTIRKLHPIRCFNVTVFFFKNNNIGNALKIYIFVNIL